MFFRTGDIGMLKNEEMEMKNNLEKLYHTGTFINKFIVIFGSNEPAERMAEWLFEHEIIPAAMIDNNEKKQGLSFKGISITAPQDTLGKMHDNAAVLIASKYFNEMQQQLEAMGYQTEKHIYKIVDMTKGSSYSLTEETFTNKEKDIYLGWELYTKIREKHGENARIFVCPFPALGDVYLVGRYLKMYCEKQQISSYVVIVTGGVFLKVLDLFDIQNAEKLSQKECDLLTQCLIFCGLKECNAEILHQRFPYTTGIGILGNYKGLCFNDHFKYTIFGMCENEVGKLPKRQGDQEYIDNYFEMNGLTKGKTVIIAPYANTSSSLSPALWIKIAREYSDKGYIVCTNSSGEEEPAIEGTKAIFFPLSAAIPIVEAAGIFIGLRSGLCDVISSARAKKVILYPDRIYQGGRYIDFYNLKKMELCIDAEEIVITQALEGLYE